MRPLERSIASPTPLSPTRIRCREIAAADIGEIARLLASGFPTRPSDEWARVLSRLTEHPTPLSFPKYGYMLEHSGVAVGVLLLIFSAVPAGGETRLRCNVSSWYVAPEFRGYAALLAARALRHKQVTYFNITPAPETLPILTAQNYQRYCDGVFVAVPALAPWAHGVRVAAVASDRDAGDTLSSGEIELLLAHAGYGCLSVICRVADRRHPFVFVPRRKFGGLRYAHLVYCRHADEFVRFAGPLGRFLARRGLPLVALDANGPVAGLVGRYLETGSPKYFKGPDRPRLGDLAFSERAMFGF